MSDEFAVIYVDRKYGNAYYDRYRNNWVECAVKHEEGRALHLDKKSEASYVMDMDMKIIIT
jgi:hypothetical protein